MLGRRKPTEDTGDRPLRNPNATLGEILLSEGIVSKGQLNEALEKKKAEGGFLGQKLVEMGFIDQKTLTLFLVKQCKIPHLNLLDYQISGDIAQLIPEDLCRQHSVLPVDKMGKILTVAMVDPLNVAALDAVREKCPELRIKPILCDWNHFETVIVKLFPKEPESTKEDAGEKSSSGNFGLATETKPKPEAKAPEPTPEAELSQPPEPKQETPTPATPSPAAPQAPPAAQPKWDELAAVMRDSMREALAPLVAMASQPAARGGSSGDAPAVAPAAIGADLVDALRNAIADSQREASGSLEARFAELTQAISGLSAAPQPAADTSGALEARFAELSHAIQQLGQGAAPAQDSAPAAAPTGALEERFSELANAISQLANAQSQAVAPSIEIPPPLDAQALAAAVGESVRDGLRESLDAIRNALEHDAEPDDEPEAQGPSQDELNRQFQVLAETIAKLTEASEVLHAAREAEREAVEEANRRELERQNARVQHSVESFGEERAPDETQQASDVPVEEALETGAPPLQGFLFDSFFPGKANDVAFSLCKAVADQPGGEYNPFFLCGTVGVGKTHLVNAVGNQIAAQHPGLRVGYSSTSRFSSHIKEALADDSIELLRKSYSRWDVLILDDIQFLGGHVEAQEEFFHVFNALHQSGRQIVIAADKPPEKLGLLEKRLISRFSGGIVTHLKPPEWEARSAILRYHATEAGVTLPEEVVAMITMRVPHDVRKLVGALRKIVAFAKVKGEDITCEMAGEILAELGIDEAA